MGAKVYSHGSLQAVATATAARPAAEKFQTPEVAEDLKLLADFVVNVGVLGMELGEVGGVGVDIGKLEFRFVQRLNYLQDVQSPATLFDA